MISNSFIRFENTDEGTFVHCGDLMDLFVDGADVATEHDDHFTAATLADAAEAIQRLLYKRYLTLTDATK